MKQAFKNSSQVECIFTDEGVTFYGAQQQVYMPYGCLDSIKMSLLGVLQATSGKQICSFAVDRKDRAAVKEMLQYARKAMETAPRAETLLIDLTKKADKDKVSADLPAEEQLKLYKAQFVQGIISKEEYDVKKRQLQKN